MKGVQQGYADNVAKTAEITSLGDKIKQLELREQQLKNALDKLDEKMKAMKAHWREKSK